MENILPFAQQNLGIIVECLLVIVGGICYLIPEEAIQFLGVLAFVGSEFAIFMGAIRDLSYGVNPAYAVLRLAFFFSTMYIALKIRSHRRLQAEQDDEEGDNLIHSDTTEIN